MWTNLLHAAASVLFVSGITMMTWAWGLTTGNDR